VAVSIVFALSWPAVLISGDRKQWSRAAMAFVALLLTGTYSVSAALGSAMGGRASAAIEEQDTKARKAKAQAKWDAAKGELDQLNTKARRRAAIPHRRR
jgi:F0F1-type ATP synthase membrane subunit b/b'